MKVFEVEVFTQGGVSMVSGVHNCYPSNHVGCGLSWPALITGDLGQ